MKYALKIKMGDGDWLYVTQDTENCWDLQPQLYQTREQAEQAATVWRQKGKEMNVKVVQYDV